jgi:hypothetical protein
MLVAWLVRDHLLLSDFESYDIKCITYVFL